MEVGDPHMLSLEKELKMAEDYAKLDSIKDGFDKGWMENCLENAQKIAKAKKIDISKRVKKIREKWKVNYQKSSENNLKSKFK